MSGTEHTQQDNKAALTALTVALKPRTNRTNMKQTNKSCTSKYKVQSSAFSKLQLVDFIKGHFE